MVSPSTLLYNSSCDALRRGVLAAAAAALVAGCGSSATYDPLDVGYTSLGDLFPQADAGAPPPNWPFRRTAAEAFAVLSAAVAERESDAIPVTMSCEQVDLTGRTPENYVEGIGHGWEAGLYSARTNKLFEAAWTSPEVDVEDRGVPGQPPATLPGGWIDSNYALLSATTNTTLPIAEARYIRARLHVAAPPGLDQALVWQIEPLGLDGEHAIYVDGLSGAFLQEK